MSLWCQGGKAREVGSGYSLPGIYGRGWRAMSSIQLQSSLWRVVSGKMSSNLHFKKIDPPLTGVFGSLSWCLCWVGQKSIAQIKAAPPIYSVHSIRSVFYALSPLLLLLTPKSPLYLYPEAQWFRSTCSWINCPDPCEISSYFASLPVFHGFCKLLSLLKKKKKTSLGMAIRGFFY